MTDRDSRPDMGKLVNRLEEDAGEAPLEDTDPPTPKDPSTPPPATEKRVDPEKLLRAWEAMTTVQKELVRAIQRNERDNRSTRMHNTVTRIVILGALVAAIIGGYRYSEENNGLLQEVRKSQSATGADVEATLKAVRAVSEAVGAKVEAETAMHPGAEEAARKKAVEAQEEALAAEVSVASDPSARATAAAKLIDVRERKRRGVVKPIRLEVTEPPDTRQDEEKPKP